VPAVYAGAQTGGVPPRTLPHTHRRSAFAPPTDRVIMDIRTLRSTCQIALGRLQESLGRHTGRQDWRLAGLLRQVQGRLDMAQAQRERAPAWRTARP
jgi:hypothetical protein